MKKSILYSWLGIGNDDCDSQYWVPIRKRYNVSTGESEWYRDRLAYNMFENLEWAKVGTSGRKASIPSSAVYFAPGQPNGNKIQTCASISGPGGSRAEGIYDQNCQLDKKCALCRIPRQALFLSSPKLQKTKSTI